ncbi:uncharacterized protein A1O9_04040 [Exophiala aquamarina CBS 119918]|uniref:gamma-glutamylcyclotransferase n=1 Tax=Exophiala aquamarina CBS 119918 TaxID=1182545 RepID=A0A072PH65_9EURO|nr:uncharacterized protein A1O9_04040 [Exophiala aquamarina CBS 119918]KEF59196.1 hypothetical protein A1O9_04040 [Exophiala aquamarina CBS 119918]
MAEQHAHHLNLTTSKTGTFYFAFGSNLSPSQMSLRLNHAPSSSVPVAIARLDSHAWIICERGYANVVSLPPSNAASDGNTVWGVVYNMSPEDEARLDLYEGHDEARNPDAQLNPDPASQKWKPYLQGGWDYNKHYLPMTVTKWLMDPSEYGVEVPGWSDGSPSSRQQTTIRALVYVDEYRTRPGAIKHEYVGRMNRGIAESVALGIPEGWVKSVLRKFIPSGVFVDEEGYVGTPDGYVEGKDVDWVGHKVEAEATEAGDHVKERNVREQAG